MEVENRRVTIKDYVEGSPSESDLEVRRGGRAVLKVEEWSNNVVVKNIYVSIDPAQINRMKKFSSSQSTLSSTARLVPGQVSESTLSNSSIRIDIIRAALDWGRPTLPSHMLTYAGHPKALAAQHQLVSFTHRRI